MRNRMRSMLPKEVRDGFECCYGCTPETGRSFDCHSKCEKYFSARRTYNEVRNQYKNIRKNEQLVKSYEVKTTCRIAGVRESM